MVFSPSKAEVSWTIGKAMSFGARVKGPGTRPFHRGFLGIIPLRGCNLPSDKSAGGPSIFERAFFTGTPLLFLRVLVGVQLKLVACAIK